MTSTASHTIVVGDDDTTPPAIALSGSESLETDGQYQSFTWNVTDVSGLNGITVTITQDGNVIHTTGAHTGTSLFNSYGLRI